MSERKMDENINDRHVADSKEAEQLFALIKVE
jgi:hypothetical protein